MAKYTYWITEIIWCPVCGENYRASTKKVYTEKESEAYDREIVKKKMCRSCNMQFKGH